MMKSLGNLIAIMAASLGVPNIGHAQSIFVEYRCDIDGQIGRMSAEVNIVEKTGPVTKGGAGSVWDVIADGTASLMYGGQLTTPSAQYTFTGYDAFADFTDLVNSARFRVKFDTAGTALMMTVNPFGPGPVQYRCELVSESGRAQPGGSVGSPSGTRPSPNQPIPYGPGAAPWPRPRG